MRHLQAAVLSLTNKPHNRPSPCRYVRRFRRKHRRLRVKLRKERKLSVYHLLGRAKARRDGKKKAPEQAAGREGGGECTEWGTESARCLLPHGLRLKRPNCSLYSSWVLLTRSLAVFRPFDIFFSLIYFASPIVALDLAVYSNCIKWRRFQRQVSWRRLCSKRQL